MKLTDHKVAGAHLVHSYAPGELRIGASVLRRSCILSAARLVSEWRPQTLAQVTLADLDPVFELKPQIVVIGSGPRQRFAQPALLGAILSRGIGCEVMETGAACRTYNVLVSEDRAVVAALLLEDEADAP